MSSGSRFVAEYPSCCVWVLVYPVHCNLLLGANDVHAYECVCVPAQDFRRCTYFPKEPPQTEATSVGILTTACMLARYTMHGIAVLPLDCWCWLVCLSSATFRTGAFLSGLPFQPAVITYVRCMGRCAACLAVVLRGRHVDTHLLVLFLQQISCTSLPSNLGNHSKSRLLFPVVDTSKSV